MMGCHIKDNSIQLETTNDTPYMEYIVNFLQNNTT